MWRHWPTLRPARISPGGYRRREPTDYDKELCLIPKDVLDFIYATLRKEWDKMQKQHEPVGAGGPLAGGTWDSDAAQVDCRPGETGDVQER
jgi:hypothetical protein